MSRKTLRSILTTGLALAGLAVGVRAETFPIFGDTFGTATPTTNNILKASGAARTITISGRNTAYINFAVGNSFLPPGRVTSARLTLYFPTVTKAGSIFLSNVTGNFSENFVEARKPAPTIDAAFTNFAVSIDLRRQFVVVDVTNQVKAWLANPSAERGLAISGDASLLCTIATKEGAASGHPATIEVDLAPADGSLTAANLANGSVTAAKLNLGSANIGNPSNGASLALATNSLTANPAPGNSLNSSTLSLRAPKGSVRIECATDPVFDASVIMPQGRLMLGGYTFTDNAHLTVATGGGNFFTSGIKLRHFDDTYGVTLQSNEVTGHFQILTHFQDAVGASALEISRNFLRTVSVPNYLTVGQVHDDGVFSKGRLEVFGGINRGANAGPIGYFASNITQSNVTDGGGLTSIYASNQIVGAAFVAFSDARLKKIQGRTDSAADLGTLRAIEITDYLYKDAIGKGTRLQKKVIAQQVEKVFPQAVSQGTDVVPDIYRQAECQDGWVNLATNLKVGERVRLIGEKEEAIREVLEVKDGAFRTAFQSGTDKVFVYGREVKDLRTVDYEAIAMLNVSATQELARKLEAKDLELAKLRAESAALRKQLAENRDRDRALAVRLERLESSGSATARVKVALKK